MHPSKPQDPLVAWDEAGAPHSRLYGDRYFSRENGLEESRVVFLSGCGLPQAWAGRDHFCVAELGFGTGLNTVALLDLWRRFRPAGAQLTLFSIEAHPLAGAEAARALAAWPELGDLAATLTTRWPGRARGFHRIGFPDLAAILDVAVMEAAEALAAWEGAADAWFLDGFAPTLNPQMWRPEVLQLVAARSAPGARAASYTVAGGVRRDLTAAGFAVERHPGFGRKRQRLEARFDGVHPAPPPAPRVAIVGAGIAGASLARAFRTLGVSARIFEADGADASRAPSALVAPRLDAGLGPAAELFAQAMRRAAALYEETPGIIIARRALQLESGVKDAARFAAIAGSDLFEPGAIRRLAGPPPGLAIEQALVIEPAPLLAAWLGETTHTRVASARPAGDGWELRDERGEKLCEADIVCLAAGMGSLALTPGLPLTPVRGQASVARGIAWPSATMFGGYVVPTRTGLMFGATHDRGDEGLDARPGDHARNLQAVRKAMPELGARLEGVVLEARTGVRATTGDYLPLAGAAPSAPGGLFVLTGLGSRGFCLAPLLAEHVAARALALPSPLPRTLAALVDPARFAARAQRRGRG